MTAEQGLKSKTEKQPWYSQENSYKQNTQSTRTEWWCRNIQLTLTNGIDQTYNIRKNTHLVLKWTGLPLVKDSICDISTPLKNPSRWRQCPSHFHYFWSNIIFQNSYGLKPFHPDCQGRKGKYDDSCKEKSEQ